MDLCVCRRTGGEKITKTKPIKMKFHGMMALEHIWKWMRLQHIKKKSEKSVMYVHHILPLHHHGEDLLLSPLDCSQSGLITTALGSPIKRNV